MHFWVTVLLLHGLPSVYFALEEWPYPLAIPGCDPECLCCAVQCARGGVVANTHCREQKQDRSLLPGVPAKLVLVWNGIHAACLFIGMWNSLTFRLKNSLIMSTS